MTNACDLIAPELSNWVFVTPEEKATVWQRIQAEVTATCFQRYKPN
jgi:predicted Fe-S protein YdhL (DUF1289 family)